MGLDLNTYWRTALTSPAQHVPSHLSPCRLRAFRQKSSTWPSLRTAEKQESSAESRAGGSLSGQTPAQSSRRPQPSTSRADSCFSMISSAC